MNAAQYTAVRLEGGLLSADLIERIAAADPDLSGNRPDDYHLAAGERLGDAASRKWEYLLGAYRAFRDRIAALPPTASLTRETRERWLLRLLDELGYGRPAYLQGGITVGEETYPISHQWGGHVPLHLLAWDIDLDRPRGGPNRQAARAPQSMMQDFLNVSDAHLWGVLSNGRRLRILRDSQALVGSAYVEFDLEAMFDGELYSDFVLLFALLHVSRLELLPRDDGEQPTVEDCWLERWRTEAVQIGGRARDQLRKQVEKALSELGTGFVESDPALREELASGRLSRDDFLHELLRLAYQLIFLFVAEDRGVLHPPIPENASPEEVAAHQTARERYAAYFSAGRLRRIAATRRGDAHTDLWRTLVIVLDALGSDGGRPELALPALGGLFFRAQDPCAEGTVPDLLRDSRLSNHRLLEAVRHLSEMADHKGRRQRIDYRHLGAEELGSVYESLLELRPRFDADEPRFWLEELPGNKRKTTGSYYTPPALIEELLKTALDPVIDRYAASGNPEDLLKLTVCDPACGSGNFLVAAGRRIATRYAALCSGDDEPTPTDVRRAMHKVVRHCLYGVDINPLSAELTKFSLWMESLEPGLPLAFLDSHIKVGNSLLGTTPALLLKGIPDEAYKPLVGDDKKTANRLRKDNAAERAEQFDLLASQEDRAAVPVDTGTLARRTREVERMGVRSVSDIREQARRHRLLLESPDRAVRKRVADAWCAAFVWPKHPDAPRAVTTATLKIMAGDTEMAGMYPQAVPGEDTERELRRLTEQYSFFHWHLEFPDVFRVGDDNARDANPDTGWQGGFDCVLGNPPWERVKLQKQEFFASRDEKIAKARNAAERKKLIEALADSDELTDRALYEEFQRELRKAAGWSHLLRTSGRYPLTGHGDVNTYSVFAETARTVIGPMGRSGLVLPTGIATDATTAPFFGDLVRSGQLVAFLEFENEEFLLSRDVHHSFRFCLMTVGGRKVKVAEADFAFGSRKVSDIEARRFTMPPEDILLLNPNTGTTPLFRSRRDAQITLGIYRRVPVLWRDTPNSNPWNISFLRMFDMANDSGLFHTREELEATGWELRGNCFVRDDRRMLPLYEAKMIHHFDHRLGTYEGQTQAQANMGTLPRLSLEQKRDPDYEALPRYWVPEERVNERVEERWDKRWFIGWRDICRSTDERTLISSAFPWAAVPDGTLLMFPGISQVGPLLGNLAAFVLDFVVRQKSGGTHLKYFTVKQLPVLPPKSYEIPAGWDRGVLLRDWIVDRVAELSCTTWDMEPLARDLGVNGPPFVWDEERRLVMRAELDAAYFRLYGVERDDVGYIMDSFGAFRRNDPERFERTKALILEIYDAMGSAEESGGPYKSLLDPPPGQGPRHPER